MVNTIKKSLDDKTIVKEYFNATGFERWRNIYGDGQVNKVQLDIREGHQQTIDKVVGWLKDDGNLANLTICDAGCGVGSLTIPLAQEGSIVFASDISAKMVGEAAQRIKQVMTNPRNIRLAVQDLESIRGEYDTVICLDVLIHYPTEEAADMIKHLSSLAKSRLILSFAPKTLFLTILKRIGEFFPGPSKATRAYQHKEEDIVQILKNNGFQIKRTDMTSTNFYYSRLLEAVR
ncbi:magnesium protoporphyrin IX methyltransferase [Geminocystis sp. NIES-3709]|uniref:magnesium protoporphyrin IX methyltransferase n=1 Tax=Geminocystis sp. NIES-3709 TaxID=1617448 RepID=UPI0005FC8F5C|nr:magnesium protoporphyrin IX methyltransferase [Geminocystis sp. NIES-3709]BAQ65295.1 Mg-protoporphyrin O-methyltransferase [Geminocystis sp. NIES-3709]